MPLARACQLQRVVRLLLSRPLRLDVELDSQGHGRVQYAPEALLMCVELLLASLLKGQEQFPRRLTLDGPPTEAALETRGLAHRSGSGSV